MKTFIFFQYGRLLLFIVIEHPRPPEDMRVIRQFKFTDEKK